MNTENPAAQKASAQPKFTLLMVLSGLIGASCASAVDAATPDDPPPGIAVQYDPQSLATDMGAKAVYQRLVKAAEAVCPDPFTGSRLVSIATEQCRQRAMARAVRQINNPRLAALCGSRGKTG
jgi:UrcA family protein